MDTVTFPPAVVADPTDDECPGCAATVQVFIIGLLPTPELRKAAFLATGARWFVALVEPGDGEVSQTVRRYRGVACVCG
jgi:hypothetical protein